MDKIRKRERKNWFYSYNMIFEQNISEHAKIVYLYLCRCADSEGESFPSYNKIGESCSISRSTAIRAIQELEKIGLLSKEERKKIVNGKPINASNIYYIYDEPNKENEITEKTPSVTQTPPLVSHRHHPSVTQTPKGLPNEGLKKEEEERIENASFSDENKEEFQELNLEILDQYKKNISSKVSNNELETLLILQEQVGIELVVKAIEIACNKNGKNIAYIKTLLEDWTSKGLTTPEEVDKYLNKWKEINKKARENREKAVELRAKKTPVAKTNQYSNRDNVPQMRNYEEREYDDDFFKNLYKYKL